MAKRKETEPVENRPIIVKKIIEAPHGGHHGGAWKVAYADFVTAMMAFFLMLWLLGATDEQERKAIADYFTPTLVEMKQASAGADGIFGGESIMSKDNYPKAPGQTGTRSISIPQEATGTEDIGGKDSRTRQQAQFEQLKKEIEERLQASAELKELLKNVRFTDTREGLRIDLVDEAEFSMFALSTDRLVPQASKLLSEVAQVIQTLPNPIVVRGHTDAMPYASGKTMNNWMLSTARAEQTRKALLGGGVTDQRVQRIEGVADREPFNPADKYDPKNRRMSITLVFMDNKAKANQNLAMAPIAAAAAKGPDPKAVTR